MRENRQSGSEGGVAFGPSLPLSLNTYQVRAPGFKELTGNFLKSS